MGRRGGTLIEHRKNDERPDPKNGKDNNRPDDQARLSSAGSTRGDCRRNRSWPDRCRRERGRPGSSGLVDRGCLSRFCCRSHGERGDRY